MPDVAPAFGQVSRTRHLDRSTRWWEGANPETVRLGWRAVTGIADEVGVFRRPPREGITPPPVRPKLRPIVDAEGAATGGIGVHGHGARRHARRKKGVVQQYVTRMVISFLLRKEDSCLCERFAHG